MTRKVVYGLDYTCPSGYSSHQFFVTENGKANYKKCYTQEDAISFLVSNGWSLTAATTEMQAARTKNKQKQKVHKPAVTARIGKQQHGHWGMQASAR